jgi:hypothetical protein
MMSSHSGMIILLKRTRKTHFYLFYNCVAHRMNLAALDASKVPDCKVISSEVDIHLNMVD